jgi:serine protease SohB
VKRFPEWDMPLLQEYGLFLAKAVTIVVAILITVGGIAALGARSRHRPRERLEVTKLNERYQEMESRLEHKLLGKKALQQRLKARKKERKQAPQGRRRVYVLDFHGDIKASQVENLRQEVTSILTVAQPEDEVVVRLESGGGLVPNYGLGASELARLRGRVKQVTVSIDRIAASGGYLMACVADRILCAPFAIIGSIGVVAQLPNFHRLLKKHDIDYELLTAGQFKRTVTVFGENTSEGREKFKQELEDTHALFKDYIRRHRSGLDVDRVGTGEYWLGERALELKLVDTLQTSDDYLLSSAKEADLYHVRFHRKQPLGRRLSLSLESLLRGYGL